MILINNEFNQIYTVDITSHDLSLTSIFFRILLKNNVFLTILGVIPPFFGGDLKNVPKSLVKYFIFVPLGSV